MYFLVWDTGQASLYLSWPHHNYLSHQGNYSVLQQLFTRQNSTHYTELQYIYIYIRTFILKTKIKEKLVIFLPIQEPTRHPLEINKKENKEAWTGPTNWIYSFSRGFSPSCYDNPSWLPGCGVSNLFYCFPYLLIQSVSPVALKTVM